MPIITTPVQKPITAAPTRKFREPSVDHYAKKSEQAVAASMGVQVRTVCGRWAWPSEFSAPGSSTGEIRICKDCQRIYDRLPKREA